MCDRVVQHNTLLVSYLFRHDTVTIGHVGSRYSLAWIRRKSDCILHNINPSLWRERSRLLPAPVCSRTAASPAQSSSLKPVGALRSLRLRARR